MNLSLAEYLDAHFQRGPCTCGYCADSSSSPAVEMPHSVDLVFFRVGYGDLGDHSSVAEVADELRRLIADVEPAWGVPCDPFDGEEHSYIELGSWLGSQGVALTLMGAGALLGLWTLLTPYTVLKTQDEALAKRMAGMGYVSLQASA